MNYTYNDIVMNYNFQKLSNRNDFGKNISLTVAETLVLKCLIIDKKSNKLTTDKDLIEFVGLKNPVVLKTIICGLKGKLKLIEVNTCIKNVYSKGYYLDVKQ